MTRDEHYTDGRRWSHISKAWILLSSWNDREELATMTVAAESVRLENVRQRAEIERLQAQLATAKGEVIWTTEKPTKPGYWWWRWLDKAISPRPVYVLEHNGSLRSGWLPKGWTLEFVHGEWSSQPIPEPKEPA